MLGAWLAGTLAALVKGTTWALFLVPLALALLADVWRAQPGTRGRVLVTVAGRGLLVAAPPLLLGLAWVGLADRIKAENPMAAFLLSGNLASFNFGALAERFDPAFWAEIAGHWCRTAMPWWAMVATGLGLCWTPARWRWPALAGLAGFAAGPLVFINLNRIHDYYHYATAGFLAVAAGLVALGLAEGRGWRRWCGVASFVALLLGQGLIYHREYFGPQTQPFVGADALALEIEQLTVPGDVIVVHGTDWSSELPYYAKRRALMIPEAQLALAPEAVEANIRLLRDEHVALVVFGGTSKDRPGLIAQRVRDFALYPKPLFEVDGRAVVYVAETDYQRMASILRSDSSPPGVRLCDGGWFVAGSREVQELGALRFGGSLRDLRPTPVRGVLPYGFWLLNDAGRRVFMAHVPTELYFEVSAGARSVSLAYRVFSGAFAKGGFSGVRFLVELRPPLGVPTVLLDDWIGIDLPERERGPRERVLQLPAGAAGEIVFRTLPGPTGNAAYGWALLDRFEVR
jgi:hypothetical protein